MALEGAGDALDAGGGPGAGDVATAPGTSRCSLHLHARMKLSARTHLVLSQSRFVQLVLWVVQVVGVHKGILVVGDADDALGLLLNNPVAVLLAGATVNKWHLLLGAPCLLDQAGRVGQLHLVVG